MSIKSIVKSLRVVANILSSVHGKTSKVESIRIGEARLVTFAVPTTDAADVQKLVNNKLRFIFGQDSTPWNKVAKSEVPMLWSVRCEPIKAFTLVEVYICL